MRKRPVNPAVIGPLKGATALIQAELDKELAELKRWEEDKAKCKAWKLRTPSAWFDRQVTRRHEAEIRLRTRALKKLGKLSRCGAKTRAGTPCQCKPEAGMLRCKLHGGKSTGPKTEAGREAIRESNRKRSFSKRS